METKVIFRKYKDGDVIALFPDDVADYSGNCTCYQHIGQHGAADYAGVVLNTKPALPSEYADLKAELLAIGYRIKIRKRR